MRSKGSVPRCRPTRAGGVDAAADPSSSRARTDPPSAFAWIAVAFGVAIVGGLVLALWAIVNGEAPDVAASPYHVPFYLGLAALVGYSLARVVRATRRGAGWRHAPTPTGSLASGRRPRPGPRPRRRLARGRRHLLRHRGGLRAEPVVLVLALRHDRYRPTAGGDVLLGPWRVRAPRPACRHRSRSPPSAGRAASP